MNPVVRENLFPREQGIDWYRALTELLPVGVFITDAAGDCRFVNLRWCEITGATAEQAMGSGWLRSVHREDREQVASRWREAVARNAPFNAEYRVQHPDGQIVWVAGNSSAVQGDAGSLLGYLVTVTDITDSRQRISELEEYQQRIRNTIEQMPLLLCAFDAEGLICAWNGEAERVTGYAAAEVIGNPAAMKMLIPSSERRTAIARQLRKGNDAVYHREWDLTARDGTLRTISWSSFARHAPVSGWDSWGIGFDVTARNLMARDLRERVKELNCLYRLSHLQQQTHLTLQEFLRRVVELIPPAWQFPELTVARIRYQDEVFQSENFQPTPWRLASVIRVRGRVQGEVEVCYLEEQTAASEGPFLHEERLLLDELAAQVADFIEHQLAARDQVLLGELSSKAEELEQFSFTISHDLKTPMTAIGGYGQYLLHQLQNQEIGGATQSARRIVEIIARMNQRLEEILKLARIGKVANLSQRVVLDTIISETLKDMEPQLTSDDIVVRVSGPFPTVIGDPVRLREVMENLLDNAIKYSRESWRPHIHIGVRRDAGEPVLFVQDNGTGIDPEYFECVFELFRRLDSSIPGEGTGLAIVKRIIEAHGGRVWVESEGRGKGTSVCFTLGKVLE